MIKLIKTIDVIYVKLFLNKFFKAFIWSENAYMKNILSNSVNHYQIALVRKYCGIINNPSLFSRSSCEMLQICRLPQFV